MAKAFLDILENAGYYAGIYCSSSYLNSFFKDTVNGRYTVWCAHYNVSKPSYTGQYDIWQHTAKGKVNGITGGSGYVDMNYCYKEDFPEVIKNAGLNGFQKTVEKPVETVEKSKRRIEIFIDGERKYSGLLDD
jgi:GH25 family lysozyme M1 (1,4-beta-N-acetylmuramidase)